MTKAVKKIKKIKKKDRGQYQEKLAVNGGFLDIMKAASQQLIIRAQKSPFKK